MENLLEGLRAAAEGTRLRILALCSETELSVSELTQIFTRASRAFSTFKTNGGRWASPSAFGKVHGHFIELRSRAAIAASQEP